MAASQVRRLSAAAFVLLRQMPGFDDVRLRIAGVQLAEDRGYVDRVRGLLASHGLESAAEFLPNLPRADKLAFLHSLSVLSVPALYGESFGLYLLEAMAAGVPVVQPDVAAFGEILGATGGGTLAAPADDGSFTASLAEGLAAMLDPSGPGPDHAARGRSAVFDRFSSDRMARDFEAVLRTVHATADESAADGPSAALHGRRSG